MTADEFHAAVLSQLDTIVAAAVCLGVLVVLSLGILVARKVG